MLSELIDIDRKLFVALNSSHKPWLDQVLYVLTNTEAWIPLYILFIYWLLKKYGSDVWVILLAIAVTIVLSDRITTGIMKPFFLRLRPSHDPILAGMVHTVNGYIGGKYGFASSHAANTFGTATLLYLLLKDFVKYPSLIFLWAAFVSYTRIYLGVHYPGDIIAGAFVGILSAIGCYWLALKGLAKLKLRRELRQIK